MSDEVNLKCTTCIYFVRKGDRYNPAIGTCRRFPPVAYDHRDTYHDPFPRVSEMIWCAEHQDFKLEVEETILPRLRKIRGE